MIKQKNQNRLLVIYSALWLMAPGWVAEGAKAQEAIGEDVPGMRMTRESPTLAPGVRDLNTLPVRQKYRPSVSAPEAAPQQQEAVPAEVPGEAETEEGIDESTHHAPAAEPPIAPLKSSGMYIDNTRVLVFSVLNKQTTRLYPLEVNEGGSITQGPLTISLLECWHSSPDSREESAALVEISEKKPGFLAKSIFLGWLFGASPSLNPFEHPVYDVLVRECK